MTERVSCYYATSWILLDLFVQGIQKWETTMTEVLIKLRDLSEKRVIPACQRLHLVLEELQGWSQL